MDAAPHNPLLDARLRLLVESYQRLTGRTLLTEFPPPYSLRVQGGESYKGKLSGLIPDMQQIELLRLAIWKAPRVIVAHGTEDDPVFFYGNRLALELFELDFKEFTRLPSRYSAEPMERVERERLLERVARQGYIDDYRGARIAHSRKRFLITAATVWNLIDESGQRHGQAATFTDWRYIEAEAGN